jgi:RNA-binding protein YlmH
MKNIKKSMRNNYIIVNNLEKISKGMPTNFLDRKEANETINLLNKKHIKYRIYTPFVDADKIIIYKEKIKVSLIEIKCDNKIKHSDIMGALTNLMSSDMFGDIIINDGYFFLIVDSVKDYVLNNLLYINKYKVELKEIDIRNLDGFKRNYEDINIKVASNRIDNIVSAITKKSRNTVKEMFKNKEIILNNSIINNISLIVKEEDIFSIKGYGKYRHIESFKCKDKVIIFLKKYK